MFFIGYESLFSSVVERFYLSFMICSILDYELLDLEIPTISIVGSIVKAGIPVLVYSGDQDCVISMDLPKN